MIDINKETVRLKPCPFCGCKAELISVPNDNRQSLAPLLWYVVCSNGCVQMGKVWSDHDAIERWNRRKETYDDGWIERCDRRARQSLCD